MVGGSQQDGSYPRPQLVRGRSLSLDQLVGFALDDADRGLGEHWERSAGPFELKIQLPFAPESLASGIGDTGFHPIVWYRIPLTNDGLEQAGLGHQGDRMILHFGAVDYSADVWVDGQHVIHHEGGETPFSADITDALNPETPDHNIVVRAEDDPLDVTLPRGKQDWQLEPHVIWYHRTTGIWRTVWVEAVPALHIVDVAWTTDVVNASVRAEVELNDRPRNPVRLRISLDYEGERLAFTTVETVDRFTTLDISLSRQRNGQHYENLLWSPESPTLIDAEITLLDSDGANIDGVVSYFGIRSVATALGRFLLNDRPYFVRSVLEQGYWPTSHLTAPSLAALRDEVELILSLGFNAARIHQKAEDPRFMFWADRLGLMIWAETAGAYEFSPDAVERLTREWIRLVRRDRSHPSIITWVPFNESWGVQHGAHDPDQQAFTLGLVHLTRALDRTRPVISNDGWEHTDSDIWSIHDYEASGQVLTERYGTRASVDAMLDGFGPAGRRMIVSGRKKNERGQPVMLTEFGGVSFAPDTQSDDSWGYSTARDSDDYRQRVSTILNAVNASSVLAGFCYTQITDTRQETNGLCDENRIPKLPAEVIARIVRGTSV